MGLRPLPHPILILPFGIPLKPPIWKWHIPLFDLFPTVMGPPLFSYLTRFFWGWNHICSITVPNFCKIRGNFTPG